MRASVASRVILAAADGRNGRVLGIGRCCRAVGGRNGRALGIGRRCGAVDGRKGRVLGIGRCCGAVGGSKSGAKYAGYTEGRRAYATLSAVY